MSICKCKVADVNVQVEINFAKAPTTSYSFKRSFSIFSEGCRAAWIDVHETQPSRTKCRSSKTEMKLQCGFGPGRTRFPRNASRSSKTAENAILRNPSAFRLSKLRWNYVFFCVRMVLPDPLAIHAFRSLKKESSEIDILFAHNASRSSRAVVKFWFCTCLLNSFA